MGWVLTSINSLGNNGNNQQFYISFANHYLGLSRLGICINNRYGFGVPLTAFDNMRQAHLLRAIETAKSKLNQPNVMWFDNFSKFRAHSIPTIQKDIFSECLWTGITINEYVGPPVDCKVQFDDDNQIVDAMPSDLFCCKDVVHSRIMATHDQGLTQFNESLVNTYEVNNIPMKIDGKRFPEMKAAMESTKNSTSHIHPFKLVKKNIGSNVGLLNILFELQTEYNLDSERNPPTKYLVLNLDENIYYRVLKVHQYS